MTAVIVAGFVTLIAPWVGLAVSFPAALLLAATMSSTDSASVFSILRSKKQGLNENLRPLLELESGSNDPMAYVLTIVLIGVLSGGAEAVSVPMSIVKFVIQMLLGGLMGYAIGRIGVWTINRINLSNYSLYPVLLLAFVFFTFSFTDLIGGNGYLAVYLAGLVLGNNQLTQKRSLTIFFDGFTWLVQIVMFLTLGLLVNLDELLQPDVLMLGCLVGAFMMFIARPITSIHNTLEAATFGLPIAFGPNYEKFKEARDLVTLGAATPIHSYEELKTWFTPLRDDEHLLQQCSRIAKDYTTAHQGATNIVLHTVFGKPE